MVFAVSLDRGFSVDAKCAQQQKRSGSPYEPMLGNSSVGRAFA